VQIKADESASKAEHQRAGPVFDARWARMHSKSNRTSLAGPLGTCWHSAF
jgi:hypothetical protein